MRQSRGRQGQRRHPQPWAGTRWRRSHKPPREGRRRGPKQLPRREGARSAKASAAVWHREQSRGLKQASTRSGCCAPALYPKPNQRDADHQSADWQPGNRWLRRAGCRQGGCEADDHQPSARPDPGGQDCSRRPMSAPPAPPPPTLSDSAPPPPPPNQPPPPPPPP